jgi:transcriptional regulator with XRE-family HTH domain
MDIINHIKDEMNKRDWTEYRVAKEAGLSQSTISNIFKRNSIPSVATLESICNAFGITLSQFFCEGNLTELSDEQKAMFDRWVTLTEKQKQILLDLIENMNNKP